MSPVFSSSLLSLTTIGVAVKVVLAALGAEKISDILFVIKRFQPNSSHDDSLDSWKYDDEISEFKVKS